MSMGFDERMNSSSISDRVRSALGDDVTQVLERIAELSAPEDADTPIGIDRGGFEGLAGPLDRLADAVLAIQDLAAVGKAVPPVEALVAASEELRRQYFKVVGTVLQEIDRYCIEPHASDARRSSWTRMNAFAEELVEWSRQDRVTTFSLNYDSLLFSALLQASGTVYDGFPGRALDDVLDRWNKTPCIYHLHGSTAWARKPDGVVVKRSMDEVRAQDILAKWAEGDVSEGQPAVVLGDMKTCVAGRYPFFVFYEEFARRLSMTELVVVGGYSFGDRPVNRLLARYLGEDRRRKMLIWSPRPEPERYLDRLQAQLADYEGRIRDEQLEVQAVELPNADAVKHLRSSASR